MNFNAESSPLPKSKLCDLWVDHNGYAFLCYQDAENKRRVEKKSTDYFVWANKQYPRCQSQQLKGDGFLDYCLYFDAYPDYWQFIKSQAPTGTIETIPFLENQYMVRHGLRLFQSMQFNDLRRCQCHLQTFSSRPNTHSDPAQPKDRILAIALQPSHRAGPIVLKLEEMSDLGERQLLLNFNATLQEQDPDILEGHNLFNFDLAYLYQRCRYLGVPCKWGRFNQNARYYKGRITIGHRRFEFSRFDLPGRTVFDTYLALQMHESNANRDLSNFSLLSVAEYLGVANPESLSRKYSTRGQLQSLYFQDPSTFEAYLKDYLNDVQTVASCFLPTYFNQTRYCPIILQDLYLRGNSNKINLMLLEQYYQNSYSLPQRTKIQRFEGGYAHSFFNGVQSQVLSFDIASLYPSLMVGLNRNPKTDTLGVFLPLLKKLREERLKYKRLAQTTEDEARRKEYSQCQASFKLLINSFYGYLGFEGARFGDTDLAATITKEGRQLLQQMLHHFQQCGSKILEADTDGVYLHHPQYYESPHELLDRVQSKLPEGIEMEFAGRYPSIFCYKTKNYALYDGETITIRGSALRASDQEPYISQLIQRIIGYLLGVHSDSPEECLVKLRDQINEGRISVQLLAKTENLNQDPNTYKKKMDSGGKGRRAAPEVALRMSPIPSEGDRISYYITPKRKGKRAEWQRALPLQNFDPSSSPYDVQHYLDKLNQWFDRFEPFLKFMQEGRIPDHAQFTQGELFL